MKPVVHSALPAGLLVDDTHAYILTNSEWGNPVPAPGVSSNVPLVTVVTKLWTAKPPNSEH